MDTIIRATLMYWVLLIVWRLIGRRTASQLSPFEMLVMFLLGGMAIQSVVADDRSVINAILAVFTVAANHVGLSMLKERFETLRKLVGGTPVIIVSHGEVDKDRLHALRMVTEDVHAAVRSKGLHKVDDVDLAVVERDGSITVFPRS